MFNRGFCISSIPHCAVEHGHFGFGLNSHPVNFQPNVSWLLIVKEAVENTSL